MSGSSLYVEDFRFNCNLRFFIRLSVSLISFLRGSRSTFTFLVIWNSVSPLMLNSAAWYVSGYLHKMANTVLLPISRIKLTFRAKNNNAGGKATYHALRSI